jgi:hypothetical protein
VVKAEGGEGGKAELSLMYHALNLAGQEFSGELLDRHITLLGMHKSFLLAACLALVALVAMGFVPRREKRPDAQADHAPIAEMSVS